MVSLLNEVGENQEAIPPTVKLFENPYIFLPRGKDIENSRPEGIKKLFVGSHLFPEKSRSLTKGKGSPIQVIPVGR